MIDFPHHVISIVIGSTQIKGWETYEIKSSMLRPADDFMIRLPFDRQAWDLCKPDTPIKVLIDDTTILTGFIDERLVPEDDEAVEIVGRDKMGRVVQESAPGINFQGLGIQQLIAAVVSPWFTTVSLSNARNRTVVRGKGKKARAAGEPVKLNTHVGTQVQPGWTRWKVIEDLCHQAGYLCWSAGDGIELIVGEPNYEQELQYRFFMPMANSLRTDEATVLGMGVRDSVADRYSRVIIVGAGTGTTANYGVAVSSRYGEARNNPADPDGVGIDFQQPKRLIQQRSVASTAEAAELAQREMDVRDGAGHPITVRAQGHGQIVAGTGVTLFAPDTLASVEDERTGVKGTFLITSCTYRSSRKGAEETTIEMVPSGTRLVSQ